MAISEDLLQSTRDSLQELLDRTFEGRIAFGPITAAPRVDHDGEDNIAIVVVFRGDEDLLDPHKLNIVSAELGDKLVAAHGFHNTPVESYIANDEYQEWLRLNSLGAPWLEESD